MCEMETHQMRGVIKSVILVTWIRYGSLSKGNLACIGKRLTGVGIGDGIEVGLMDGTNVGKGVGTGVGPGVGGGEGG